MYATRSLRNQAMELLAADDTTLAPAANANKMALLTGDFDEGESLTFADLSFATFTGSTPILAGTGTQPEGFDPNSDDSVIDIKRPAGGFRWECTAAPATPEVITGYALIDNGATTLWAAKKFDTPITITSVGQIIDDTLINARISLPANTLT